MDQNFQKRPNNSLLYSFYATPRNTSASLKKTMPRKTKNSMANSKATSTDIPSSSKAGKAKNGYSF